MLISLDRKNTNTTTKSKSYKLYPTKTMTLSLGLFLIGILGLSCLSTSIFKQQDQALAQQSVQTTKSRNLVIDLGNGLKTNATLTYPAVGKGPSKEDLARLGKGTSRSAVVCRQFSLRIQNSPFQLH